MKFLYWCYFSLVFIYLQIMELDSHKLLVGAGVPADCLNFNEYIQRNLVIYELNNDIKLSTHGAANYIRGEVSFTK
jgi:20S proteasome subunit beta 4